MNGRLFTEQCSDCKIHRWCSIHSLVDQKEDQKSVGTELNYICLGSRLLTVSRHKIHSILVLVVLPTR